MEKEIRVKIRKHGNPSGKLLRFPNSIQLHPLMRKIAYKLLRVEEISCFDASQHQLWLGGEFLVEAVSEIDNGDELVLKRIDEDGGSTLLQTSYPAIIESTPPAETASVTPVAMKQEESTDQVPIKQEPHESGELLSLVDDDDDDTVIRPDANTSSQSNQPDHPGKSATRGKRKASPIRRVKKKKPEIITIDDESDTDDDDDSSNDGFVEDGSDAWMSSDNEEEEKDDERESDFEPDSDDDSDEEEEVERKKSRANKSNRTKESPLQVIMDEKDVPLAPGKRKGKNEEGEEEVSLLVNGAGRQKTEKAVKERIMKLLNTGFHDQSNENEAKNAMKLAQRLMRKHNLSQALLLKERDEQNNGENQTTNEVLRGGMVPVRIINRKTQKPALFARWLSTLAYHIGTNFDVKSYHTVRRGRKCEVTFYGIYINAQLAGYAFRVATERISQMGASYEPKRRSNISLASCRLSYCIGIVKGIGDEVNRTIQEEKLKRLRKLERARLAVSQGEAYEESDDDEGSDENDNDGPSYSFPNPPADHGTSGDDRKPSASDASIKGSSIQDTTTGSHQSEQAMNPGGSSVAKPPPVLSGMALDQRLQELENENQAALTLVDHRKKVAEDVLKDNGVKLSSARPRARMNFDGKSYRQGIEDSKEVDINQRAIRDEVKVKREVKTE